MSAGTGEWHQDSLRTEQPPSGFLRRIARKAREAYAALYILAVEYQLYRHETRPQEKPQS